MDWDAPTNGTGSNHSLAATALSASNITLTHRVPMGTMKSLGLVVTINLLLYILFFLFKIRSIASLSDSFKEPLGFVCSPGQLEN